MPHMLPIHTWYLPTTFGDIRLIAVDKAHTKVELCKLTRAEHAAVNALRNHSIAPGLLRSPWAAIDTWSSVPSAFKDVEGGKYDVVLDAPIGKVESYLTRVLRKDRRVVSVISYKPGEFIEATGAYADGDPGDDNKTPYRASAPDPEEKRIATREPETKAVTVAAPVQGCPEPDFGAAHVRASEVLRAFLSPEQVADFEEHQQFLTVGAVTGHRYAITSRHARSKLQRSFRTVFDLDEGRPYCVHDWDIPPAEEMLTMHLLISLPDWEPYIRHMEPA